MLLLKEADFRKEIKTAPRAGYVFVGDEDYLKSFALRAAEEAFCPDSALAIFNVLRIDGLEPGTTTASICCIPIILTPVCFCLTWQK